MSKILNMCGDLLNSSREVALKSMKDTRIGLKHHRDIFEAAKAGDEKRSELIEIILKKHPKTFKVLKINNFYKIH